MSNTLRKRERSLRVAEAIGCSNTEGERALNVVLESITDTLRAGDKIVLTGFGSFELVEVKARKAAADPGRKQRGTDRSPGTYARALSGGSDARPGGEAIGGGTDRTLILYAL